MTAPITPPVPTPRPKGLSCLRCAGTVLLVRKAKYPCPGVVVRYRRCKACGEPVKTRECIVVTD